MAKPTGEYLKEYVKEDRTETIDVVKPDGTHEQRVIHFDYSQMREPIAGLEQPLLPHYRTPWAFNELYSAWKDLMREKNLPAPEWEEQRETLVNVPDAEGRLLSREPQTLAAEYQMFIPRVSAETPDVRFMAQAMNIVDEYAQRYEFLPGGADSAMAQDYRLLAEISRNQLRESDDLMRMGAWLKRLESDPAIQDLIERARKGKVTETEAKFYQTYMRTRIETGPDRSVAPLRADAIETSYNYLGAAVIDAAFMLRYIWGDEDENDWRELRRHFGYRTTGMDDAGAVYLFHAAVHAGVSPDSLIGFAEQLRAMGTQGGDTNTNLRQRLMDHIFDTAVMHIGAGRKEESEELTRFAQRIGEEIMNADLPEDEMNRQLRKLLNGRTADPLSERARETLIANFDRTFGKYFSREGLNDGSAFRHILGEGISLSDIFNAYYSVPEGASENDRAKAAQDAARKAKVELMTRILAGEQIRIEKLDRAGRVKLREDGTPDLAPLEVTSVQPEMEDVIASIRTSEVRRRERQVRDAGVREQLGEVSRLNLDGQEARFNRDFLDAHRHLWKRITPPDHDLDGVMAKGLERAERALAAEGIYDAAAHSVLGAREVADIQQAARGLALYQGTVPAAQAQAYGRYLALLERSWQVLDQVRFEQEFMRIYPEMGEYLEEDGRVPESVGMARGADAMLHEEAERLHRSGMALARLLQHAVGEGGPVDREAVRTGDEWKELREFLQAEGLSADQVLAMSDAIRQSIPAAGNRFAAAEALPVNIGAAGKEITDNLLSPEALRGLDALTPEARQYALQSFDRIMGQIFGSEERERLAARGMDIYDCIFVDGRSLSDLYRQTPEKRSYEKMESDLKCRFVEHMLTGEGIDVIVADAAGQEKLVPLQPYDSTSILAGNSALSSVPRRRRSRTQEAQIRSRAEESRQRLGQLLSDPKARRDREEYIRYARGERAAAPGRDGFAVPFAALREEDSVVTTAMPFGNRPLYDIMDLQEAAQLLSLWQHQQHEPGGHSVDPYPGRLRMLPEDSFRNPEDIPRTRNRLKATLDRTDRMFSDIVRMAGADAPDPQIMERLGIRVPEQLFYIGGIPVEEYIRGIPVYEGMTPDYSPDSEYMRILRGEIVSATMGSVDPVDIAAPEIDPVSGEVRSRVRELRVDYSDLSRILRWQDLSGRPVNLRDRQAYLWRGEEPEDQRQNLEYIYPERFTADARRERQRQIDADIRRSLTPVIRLAGSSEGRLTPQQRADYLEVRSWDPASSNGVMASELAAKALPLYEEITWQLGLGRREAEMLLEAGVISSETELFYIDGVPAAEYFGEEFVRDRNGALINANREQALKAKIAAAAVSGRHIVEVGRVAMDEAGHLRAGVADVHVDLEPLHIPADGQVRDRNAALRASEANLDQENRRGRIRGEMQARIDRAAELTYSDGNDAFYRAAARRFDSGRPELVSSYFPGADGAGRMVRDWCRTAFPERIPAGPEGDRRADQLVSSLAQMYMLSKRENVHLVDLTDPESFKNEKAEDGREVLDALEKGISGRGWDNFDAILTRVGQMVRPMEPGRNAGLTPPDARRLNMRAELEAVMGLDSERRPPYSQAELFRLMDLPEHAPHVSALLAFAGQLAGDTDTLYSPRWAAAPVDTPFNMITSRWAVEFHNALDSLQLVGRNEEAWLDAAQNSARRADTLPEASAEEAADLRLRLEDARRLMAARGTLSVNDDDEIRRTLRSGIRPRIRRTGRELSGELVREMANRPLSDLGQTDYTSPAVRVTIPSQFDTAMLRTLANLADRNRSADPAEQDATIFYAVTAFNQMFTANADPIFSREREGRMAAEGIGLMDRIYIEGRSVNDLYGEKYRDLMRTNRDQAIRLMKTDFMIRMLQGARIDVAVERNGVETVSVVALQTEVEELNRRAWLTVPRSLWSDSPFIDPSEQTEEFTVPPMTAEISQRIFTSQWAASERAIREAAGPAAVQAESAAERAAREQEELLRQEARMRAGRTGDVPDSDRARFNPVPEGSGGDVRTRLFRLYSGGEGELRRIFGAGQPGAEDRELMSAAADMADRLIRGATYIKAPEWMRQDDKVIPTDLQRQMGYGPDNMTEMCFIDGLSVDEYARRHEMGDAVAEGRPDRENNRKAILAAALLSGEHRVDMIRVGTEWAENYDREGNVAPRGEGVVPEENYKTGILELQANLTAFDGMERFYQSRPSDKADAFYSDDSGRRERHMRLKQAADEKLFVALTRNLRTREAMETAAGGALAAAAVNDQISRPAAQPAQQRTPAAPAQPA